MSVESATNIAQLDPTLPAATDPKSEGDNHIRLIKSTLQATLPSITGISTSATSNSAVLLATTSQVQNAILASTGISAQLPGQGSSGGKVLATDGTSATWIAVPNIPWTTVSGTTQTAVAGNAYMLTNVAATTVTLPATPAANDKVAIKVANGLTTNVVNPNGATIEGTSGSMTIDSAYAAFALQYINSSWRFV